MSKGKACRWLQESLYSSHQKLNGHTDFSASSTSIRYVRTVVYKVMNMVSLVLLTAGHAAQEHHDSLELLNGAERMFEFLSTADGCDKLYQPPNRLSSEYCANRKQTHCFLGYIPCRVCYKGSEWLKTLIALSKTVPTSYRRWHKCI